jgi:hypothetical protein
MKHIRCVDVPYLTHPSTAPSQLDLETDSTNQCGDVAPLLRTSLPLPAPYFLHLATTIHHSLPWHQLLLTIPRTPSTINLTIAASIARPRRFPIRPQEAPRYLPPIMRIS